MQARGARINPRSIHVAAIAPGFDEALHAGIPEDAAQGRVHAAGTHAELLATDPIYQEIYASQMKGGMVNGAAV